MSGSRYAARKRSNQDKSNTKQDFVKKSGFKVLRKEGGWFGYGWRIDGYSGNLVKIKVNPKKGADKTRSQTGKEWLPAVAFIRDGRYAKEVPFNAMIDLGNNKVYIKELNLICNPSAPNGGYFGKHLSK